MTLIRSMSYYTPGQLLSHYRISAIGIIKFGQFNEEITNSLHLLRGPIYRLITMYNAHIFLVYRCWVNLHVI